MDTVLIKLISKRENGGGLAYFPMEKSVLTSTCLLSEKIQYQSRDYHNSEEYLRTRRNVAKFVD